MIIEDRAVSVYTYKRIINGNEEIENTLLLFLF